MTRKPDVATNYDPRPRYLRELLARAGLTQLAAAKLLGVPDRTMRDYLSEKNTGSVAPYCLQFALESLAMSGDEIKQRQSRRLD